MQDVELLAHKVDGILEDRVGLVVTVNSHQSGHNAQKAEMKQKFISRKSNFYGYWNIKKKAFFFTVIQNKVI